MAADPDLHEGRAATRSSAASPSTVFTSASSSGPGRTTGKKRPLADAFLPAQTAFKGAAVRATKPSMSLSDERPKAPQAKPNSSNSNHRNDGNASELCKDKENRTRPIDKRRFARRTRPPTEKPPEQQEKKRDGVPANRTDTGDGVSDTTSFLFKMNCQILRTQLLEYDLQLAELSEKSAQMQTERTRWENKIAKMQRKLRKLDEMENECGLAAGNVTSSASQQPMDSMEQQARNNNGMLAVRNSISDQTDKAELTESATSSCELVENEIQETMRLRSQRLSDITKTLYGVNGLLDLDTRLP